METNDGDYTFEYDNDYIQKFPYQFITFSMPVSEKLYRENRLFPFFEGLNGRLAVGNSFRKLENQQKTTGWDCFGVLQKLHWCSKCRTYNCEK